jgi:hypothetical protein
MHGASTSERRDPNKALHRIRHQLPAMTSSPETKESSSMSGKLTDWARPHYRAPGGRPFVFYIVYGAFGTLPRIDAQQYRTLGVYPGLRRDQFNRNGGYFPPFDEGELWDTLLMENPELARSVSNSDKCLILRGEIDDPRVRRFT